MGLIPSDGGNVELFGEAITSVTPQSRHRVGYVPQTMDSFQWMAVDRCLRYVGAFYDNWDDGLIGRLRDEWQVPQHTRVHKLSVGERQKLSILLALGHHPDLLILDEPVASLDPGSRRNFLREVVTSNDSEGQTILFATHIVSDLERIAGDVIILHQGTVRYSGSLDDLKEEVVRLECSARFDRSMPLFANRVIRSHAGGLTVKDWSDRRTAELQEIVGAPVTSRHLSLEEIFLEITA